FNTLVPVFKETGFIPISADSYLFINKILGILLILYVNNLFIAALIVTIIN
ncbi:uncharacterized protein B0T23DRAFT_324209, partial [Neurospora hispaniola]